MKKPKKSIAILVVATIIAGSILFVLVMSAQPSMVPSSKQSQPDPEVPATIDPNTPVPEQIPGSYQQYSTTLFNETRAPRRVLFFHAGWCPQCRMVEQSIQESGVPDNMIILKTDFDTEHALRQKYGVTMQTTFVEVDAKGNLIKKHVAYYEPNLRAVLKELGL